MYYSFNQHLIVFNEIYYFYYKKNFFSHVLAIVAFWFPAFPFSVLYLIVCLIIFNFFYISMSFDIFFQCMCVGEQRCMEHIPCNLMRRILWRSNLRIAGQKIEKTRGLIRWNPIQHSFVDWWLNFYCGHSII